jgi:hypothetical protein
MNLIFSIRCKNSKQKEQLEKLKNDIKSRTKKSHPDNLEDAYNSLLKQLRLEDEMREILKRRESLTG